MKLLRSDIAEDDLSEIGIQLDERAGERTMERFLEASAALFRDLLRWPRQGRRCDWIRVREARRVRVPKFGSYVVIYSVTPDRIEILRVLHGARDIERLTADEG